MGGAAWRSARWKGCPQSREQMPENRDSDGNATKKAPGGGPERVWPGALRSAQGAEQPEHQNDRQRYTNQPKQQPLAHNPFSFKGIFQRDNAGGLRRFHPLAMGCGILSPS